MGRERGVFFPGTARCQRPPALRPGRRRRREAAGNGQRVKSGMGGERNLQVRSSVSRLPLANGKRQKWFLQAAAFGEGTEGGGEGDVVPNLALLS